MERGAGRSDGKVGPNEERDDPTARTDRVRTSSPRPKRPASMDGYEALLPDEDVASGEETPLETIRVRRGVAPNKLGRGKSRRCRASMMR